MSPIDFAIIAVVAILMVCAIRSLSRSKGECAGCGKAGGCSVHATGHGDCPAAASVVFDVQKGVDESLRK